MQLSDSQTVLVASQLGLAGLTLAVGIDQTLAWWRERSAPLCWMALTSFALVAVLVANVAVTQASAGAAGDAALLARAVAISAAIVLVVLMASSIGDRKTPHWLFTLVVSFAALRVLLWVGTDLVFAHRWVHGLPVYGPLLVVINAPLMALTFGYLLVAVMRRGGTREQVALVAGASVSLMVGAVSMAVREGPTAELLTGFTVVPLVVSGLAVLSFRMAQAHRSQRLASERQGALADLSH